MKAWLVTWESIYPDQPIPKQIAGIFNPRWSSSRITEIVEIMYATEMFTTKELSRYADCRKFNPYPAKTHHGWVNCGHNPYLEARRVTNLEVTVDDQGNEIVSWEDPLNDGTTEKMTIIIHNSVDSLQDKPRG